MRITGLVLRRSNHSCRWSPLTMFRNFLVFSTSWNSNTHSWLLHSDKNHWQEVSFRISNLRIYPKRFDYIPIFLLFLVKTEPTAATLDKMWFSSSSTKNNKNNVFFSFSAKTNQVQLRNVIPSEIRARCAVAKPPRTRFKRLQ